MVASQSIEYKGYSLDVFEKKHYMERTTGPGASDPLGVKPRRDGRGRGGRSRPGQSRVLRERCAWGAWPCSPAHHPGLTSLTTASAPHGSSACAPGMWFPGA